MNVRDYGAKGDSLADDTASIQACHDAAPEGETIHFPVICWLADGCERQPTPGHDRPTPEGQIDNV